MKTENKSAFDVKTLVTLGMLTALSYAVMAVCKVIPPVLGFLSFDLKDTVMAIGGFLFGVPAALCMAVVVPLIEFITVSDTGPYGLIMNIFATALFVIPAVYIYRRKHTTSSAVAGLAVGTACLTVGMFFWNFIITPLYYNMARDVVMAMMPTIAAFNVVKGVLNAALIMILYPPVSTALRKVGLVEPSKTLAEGEKRKFNYVPLAVSVVVLITAIFFVWALLQP